MIDPDKEDIEKILTHKFTWKSFLRIGIIFISVIFAFILITFSRGSENAGGLLFFGITIVCLVSSIIVSEEKKHKQIRQTLTIMKCDKCGLRKVKDFQNGDYIFQDAGKCDKCDGNYKVIEIYSIKIKEKEQDKKKHKNKD